MERGAQALIKALLAALLFGGLVLALHPDYRAALRATGRHAPEASPIWRANASYYPMVGLPGGPRDADPE